MSENPIFHRFADPKSILAATPFHNVREIGKSKAIVSVARCGHPYQTWWGSHHPPLEIGCSLGVWGWAGKF